MSSENIKKPKKILDIEDPQIPQGQKIPAKPKMSAKIWLVCFFAVVILFVLGIAAFNFITDPFGIFGDWVLDWYSNNMTQNPSPAKIAYIDKNHKKYDSYIVGSSGSSSFPVEKFNEYNPGSSFFNLFSYGADMEKTYLMSKYVLDNCEVKNLIVCIGIMDAVNYKKYEGKNPITEGLHGKITGEFLPTFYSRYLFANPSFGMRKLDHYINHDLYTPEYFDVFDTNTGSYDDRLVNVTHIGNLDAYLEQNKSLKPEYRYNPAQYLPYVEECVARVKDIKLMCEEKNVNFMLIFMPSYYELIDQLDMTEVSIFYNKLAEVTDFWDFFLSPASCEPRYFQDYMHVRTALGAMAISRIYGDESVYVPEDFGFYVTKENCWDYAGGLWDTYREPEPGQSAKFNALMYKNIDTSGVADDNNISPERFEAHIKALSEAGYNAVSVGDLFDFIERGIDLPEKPLLITFDDGYMGNYEYALPVLEKYGMKASVFPIGISMGTDKYRDTDRIEGFSYIGWDEAREMSESGVFEIGSHSFDMHLYAPFEPDPELCRVGMGRRSDESEDEYIAALRHDIEKFIEVYEKNMKKRPEILSFPAGEYEQLTEVILCEYGFKATFGITGGENEILKGLPQTLYGLNRYTVSGAMSANDLLELLGG